MERLIIAVIIIAAVLFLFGRGTSAGGQLVGGTAGGPRIGGPSNPSSALPPGYRSSAGN
ncbi:MAG TPA: hypothetical protein VNH17_17220 [Streptosporangiaceae bacterium]|nr:hypothetical protein [Streptosporangiaceae bacterium]